MRLDRLVLAVGASGDAGGVFAALSDAYTVHAEPAETTQWTWLDTADRRLRRASMTLREERHGKRRDLVFDRYSSSEATAYSSHVTITAPITGVRWPARLSVLGDSAPALLNEVVGVRALLPVAEVENRRILLRLMDEVGKTRVRVAVNQQRLLSPRKAALPLHVEVGPLRGYERDGQRCAELLASAMGAVATSLSPVDATLAATGRQPGTVDEPSPVEPADPAVRPLARALLDYVTVVDEARDGALADLDTEFLHDLRSAIRSTRALLSVAGHLLPGRSAVRVERDLGWLYEQTAVLRAIDIALFELSGTATLDVPRPGELEPVREVLRRRRRTELRRMRQALRAPRAPAAFTAWRRDLDALLDADVLGPTAAESAAALPVAALDAVAAIDPTHADYVLRLDALREVLAAYSGLHTGGHHLSRDVEATHEVLRLRDRVRIVDEQLRTAAHIRTHAGHELDVDALLATGAALQTAGVRAAELDTDTRRAHDRLVGKSNRRRVRELV